ncbi:MAG TPA: DsbC family protein [Burkholderiales bacterium]|nr:DsbC family protein [Burkholderiales bacterium]
MRKSLAVFAILFLTCANALAGDIIEAGIKAALQKRRPEIPVDNVTKTPIAGLYEVFAGGQLYYTDAQAHYILDGQLFDLERNVSLSDERLKQLTAINFDQLPLDLALKRVKGDGSRKLVYFGDPDCPYCRQLEQELTKVNNVTIYTFLLPLPIHPNADSMARKIWCSKDRAKAWNDYMLNNAAPVAIGDCATPIERTKALADRVHVNGTPAVFFADGQREPGVIPASQIEQRFAEIQAKNK